jgi:hypothetical protein
MAVAEEGAIFERDGLAHHKFRLTTRSVIGSRYLALGVSPWFVSLLVSWLPFVVLIGVWVFPLYAMAAAIRNCGDRIEKLSDRLEKLSDRG